MSRSERWAPRRHVGSWNSDGKMIAREQRGHRLYQVTEYAGISVVSSTDYTDPVEAQREWIRLQRDYLDLLEQRLPPPLPVRPGQTIDLTYVDDLAEGMR